MSDEIRSAKDVIQALIKARKTIRMYPENNPIYRKTVEECFSKFVDLLSYKDDLVLKIKQNEIFLDSDQIYYNPEKDDNLALFFFKDGLRELTFTRGLEERELEEFLRIIALDFEREAVDDDVVTMMWEKGFQNIKYVADEAFLMEDENYEEKAVREIKSRAPETDEVLKAYAAAFESEDVKEISIINLTDRDLQALVKEMDKDLLDKTPKIYEILFEMLSQSETSAEYEDVHRLLKDVFSYCLRQGNLKSVVDIMRRTKELSEKPSIHDAVKRQLKLLLSSVNSAESVKSVGEIFGSDAEVDENVLNEYSGFLDRSAIPYFMLLLGELESIRGRKIVINILIQLGKKDILAVAKGLQDPHWYVVRNIIYVLRHIGDKKAVEYLLATARHNDERVRKEAIKTLGELKSPLALQTLKECLGDPGSSIRRLAVRALGSISSETAKRVIVEHISGKDFRDREFDEKREFYEVLAHWNDADMIELMIKTLKKTSLFRRARHDESRACAAHSLGLMGSKDALPALYKFRDSNNKLLKEYAIAAIKKIENAR
ncbi:MAG TPA: HEAT repeat domain-containing protein [Thermodesulfovibrionales bacterium]|nr:HEAT repeat domain-containing protein [Thermodesulfovibrionales bacterium]